MSTCPIEIRLIPDRRWTAVHTRARCEKVVARVCEVNDIPCYLPLRRRAQRYQRRTVETFLPMFPGYVFVCIDPLGRATLLGASRAVAVLSVDDTTEARLIEELQGIQQLESLAREQELIVEPELASGKAVRITAGPLAGVHGIVSRRTNRTRVTVNVEILGQAVSVDLDIGEVHTD